MPAPDTDISRTGTNRVLAAVLAGGGLSALGVGLFAFIIPLVSLDERISGAWLGTAFAGYYLAKLLISPLSGMAADRFGPRPVLTAATIAGCLVPLTYFLSPGLTALYAIQIAMGLVTGLIRPVGLAALGGSAHGANLTRRFAVHGALFNAAAFLGPLLGGLLYAGRSLGPVLAVLAGCMGLAALATYLLMPGNAVTSRSPASEENDEPKQPLEKTAALLVAIGGRSLGIGLLAAFYPIVLAQVLGRNGQTIAALFALPGLATFLGLMVTGRFGRTRPEIGRIALGMLLSAAGLYGLGQCAQLWQFAVFSVIMGGGAALSIPSSMGFASSLSRRQGAVFGAANLASGIGLLLGPLLGGLLVQQLHSPAPGLQVAGLLGALTCLPLLFFLFRDRLHWGKGTVWLASGAFALAVLLLLGRSLTPSLPVATQDKDLYRFSDVAMGTVVNLTLEAGSKKAATDAARRAMTVMRALQRDFDHRNPEGSVGRINRAAGTTWVTPTPRTFELLKRALAYSRASRGVFDPTVGALTTQPFYYAMDPDAARASSDLVDYRLIRLDEPGGRIRLEKEGMALDLGGIAKGTVVDAAVALLQKQGIRSGTVEAGGDFRCFGPRDWTVGLRHPRRPDTYRTITVRERSVCGSGDYQQFLASENGEGEPTRHHIIDPVTMASADESIGVSVIADTAEEADALATTLFIMGPARGTEFLKANFPDSAALWFLHDQSVTFTDNFPH